MAREVLLDAVPAIIGPDGEVGEWGTTHAASRDARRATGTTRSR